METFGALPTEPLEACIDEVEVCDVFVGVYAHRYGHVPDGQSLSITELEFRHAQHTKRPTLCFLVDETLAWPEDLIEDEPGRSALQGFKDRLRAKLVADTFSSPEDLARRAAPSVAKVLYGRPRYDQGNLQRLLENLSLRIADSQYAPEPVSADASFKYDLVALLESVMACHAAYVQYSRERSDRLFAAWTAHVGNLVLVLNRVRVTLAAAWPDVFSELHSYAALEAVPPAFEMQRQRVAGALDRICRLGNERRLLAEMTPLREEADPRLFDVLMADYETYQSRHATEVEAPSPWTELLGEPSVWTAARRLRELLNTLMSPSEIAAAQRAYVAEFG